MLFALGFLQVTSEEVGDGGEVFGGLGCAGGPAGCGFDVFERVVGGVSFDEKEADVGVVGGGDLFGGVLNDGAVGEAGEGHLHVGLAGGEPEIADEDVVELDGVRAADDESEGAASGLRGKVDAPTADVVGGCGGGEAVEFYGDLFSGGGAAPDVDGHVALKDHVAGEEFGERDFGVGTQGEYERDDEDAANETRGHRYLRRLPL